MEKHSGAADHEHSAECAHRYQRRLFVGGQHRIQPPSGHRVQRKEYQAAEQAQQDRRFIGAADHGGSRNTGCQHGHRRFQQQEQQAHPIRPLQQQPHKAGDGEAEQSAAAASEQQTHSVDARQQGRGQATPDAGGIFQQVQRHEQRQRKETGRYVGIAIQAADTGGDTFLQSAGVIRTQGVHQSVERPEQPLTAAHVQRNQGNDGGNGRAAPQQAGDVPPIKAGQQNNCQREGGDEFIELRLGVGTEGRIDGRRTVDDGEGQQTQYRHGQPLLKA